MNKILKDIERALRRCEKSEGRPVARRNARKDAIGDVRRLRQAIDREFPPLRRNGKAIKKGGASGRYCPECRIPMRTVLTMARHYMAKHAPLLDGSASKLRIRKCWCGKPFRLNKELAAHFAQVKDLGHHRTLAALGAFEKKGALGAFEKGGKKA